MQPDRWFVEDIEHADKTTTDLTRQPEQLVVRVGSFKRHVPLPRTVSRLKTAGAKMEEDRLVVRFAKEETP